MLRSIGEALGFAAEPVEQPNLGLAFVAGGKESDELAVGTPAGVRRGVAPRCQSNRCSAGSRSHPDALFVLVFFEKGGLDGASNPTTLAPKLRSAAPPASAVLVTD